MVRLSLCTGVRVESPRIWMKLLHAINQLLHQGTFGHLKSIIFIYYLLDIEKNMWKGGESGGNGGEMNM